MPESYPFPRVEGNMKGRQGASGRKGEERMQLVGVVMLTLAACGPAGDSENPFTARPKIEAGTLMESQKGVGRIVQQEFVLVHSWKILPDKWHFSMFQYAASQDDPDVIAELAVGHRLSLDAKDDKGYAPLHYGAIYDAPKVIAELINQGANTEVTDNDGNTPLHTAVHNNSRAAVAELVVRGANVHAEDRYGRTPMYYATLTEEFAAVAELLACGANVDGNTGRGRSPSFQEVLFCVRDKERRAN